jgi:hypothetical protein
VEEDGEGGAGGSHREVNGSTGEGVGALQGAGAAAGTVLAQGCGAGRSVAAGDDGRGGGESEDSDATTASAGL